MRGMKHLLGAVACVGVCLLADAAKADYVCKANFSPVTTTGKGNSGYVQFTTYSGPDCTGSFISVWNFCSVGATSSSCTENTAMHYTSTQLLSQWDALRLALSSNLRLSIGATFCIGAPTFCVGYIEIAAN